jgi:hypothetical protein
MVDPAIDRPTEPFCYFSHPTDVIGVMDGKEATLVTPEGYLFTGYGELMFFAGSSLEPVRQRVKTLERGFVPIVGYRFTADETSYRVEMFAATLDGNCESPLVNFVRVTMKNVSPLARRAFFAAATRYQNEENTDWGFGDYRFPRPAKAAVLGQYEQAGVEFDRAWVYEFAGDAFLRDGKVIYLFPAQPTPMRMITLRNGMNEPAPVGPQQVPTVPTTPVGVVVYDPVLRSSETRELVFLMPYEPVPPEHPLVGQLRAASYDQMRDRTVRFWEEIVGEGMEIALPEPKVVDTFKASLVYSLIARNYQGGHYIQKVNEFQYDNFWLRDAAYAVRMYDLTGYPRIARQCLEFFPASQREDGSFISQEGHHDGWGQAMWIYGRHAQFTHDREFAASVMPSVRKAVAWLQQVRSKDSLGLLPPGVPGDNEDIAGHITGHDFWALAGLRSITDMARDLGEGSDAGTFEREYGDLRATLLGHLRRVTAGTGGYIPPCLDVPGGQDWGNMLSVFPERTLEPFDPMVSATLKATRAKYREGLMTYGNGRWLHHYLGTKNTETELLRGEQRLVIEDLYALLLHTGATHTGFEFYVLPWGTRDFGMNLSPHGWFAFKYRILLRNMVVREEAGALHLFSDLSPAWVGEGQRVAVRRAPTLFGTLDAEIRARRGGAAITIESHFTRPPDSIVVHLPWFLEARRAEVDGRPISVTGGRIVCPAEARRIDVAWRSTGLPPLTYDNAVKEYTKEYRRRYDRWIRGVEEPRAGR